MPKSGLRIGLIVSLVLSLPLLCCALFSGMLLPWAFNLDVVRVEPLEPISAVAMEDGVVGREALIQGKISPRNQAAAGSFVAYELSVRTTNADGDEEWRSAEQVYPPMLIDLPDGTVQITGGYNLMGPDDTETIGDQRYTGLRVNQPVIVVGTLIEGAEGIELEADFIAPGTRDSFLADQYFAIRFFRYSGIFSAICGSVLLIVAAVCGVWLFRRRRTQHP